MRKVIKAKQDIEWYEYALAEEIAHYCKIYGYELYNCDASRTGRLFLSVIRHDDNRFLPEIFYNRKFTIQTTSYGDLELKDYELFLEGVNAAYQLVSELEDVISQIGVDPGITVALYEDY